MCFLLGGLLWGGGEREREREREKERRREREREGLNNGDRADRREPHLE